MECCFHEHNEQRQSYLLYLDLQILEQQLRRQDSSVFQIHFQHLKILNELRQP